MKLPPEQPSIPQRKGGTGAYWVYLLPGFVLLLVIVIVPLIWNVALTFTKWRGVGTPEFIGLENWQKLLTDEDFWTSFTNSIWMVLAMVVVPTIIGLLIAALLFDVVGRKFGGKVGSFLRATYYLPQILPIVVAGIVIGWIVRPGADGALNQILGVFGIPPYDWLGQMPSALIVLMVVLIWVQIGYPVVIFMAALQRVDPELYEAAELDGANWFQRFSAITMSIIRPEIFVVTLTSHDRGAQGLRPRLRDHRRRPGRRHARPGLLRHPGVLHEAQRRIRRDHRHGADHRRRRRLHHLHPGAELDGAQRKGGPVMAVGTVLVTTPATGRPKRAPARAAA